MASGTDCKTEVVRTLSRKDGGWMRYDSWAVRLTKLAAPLALYLLIGMMAMAGSGGYTLATNLMEKAACACVMGYLFIKDSKTIFWPKGQYSILVWVLLAAAGAGICIGVNQLFAATGLIQFFMKDYELVTSALYGQNLLLEVLVMVIAAPIAEELLFRGVLFRRMRTYCSYLPAAIITALIFALIHGNILQGIYGFAVGMLFTYVYEMLRTIWAPVVCHAAANAVSLLVTENDACSRLFAASPVISMMIGIAVVTTSIVLIEWLFFKQSEGKK